MRIAAIRTMGDVRSGVLQGDEFKLLPAELGDILQIIEAGIPVHELEILAANSPHGMAVQTVDLAPPLGRFRRDILCTGWNYWDHFEEGIGKREGQEVEPPRHPTFFTKGPDTAVGPRDPIAFDERISEKWDYEAELALVIGRTGRSIPESRAENHVWGYMLANDVSQRDLQRKHGGQWLKGKSIDGTMPIGPWIVTADEIDPQDVHLQCFVNGNLMQDATTAQMAFPIPALISELSWGMTVRPGDVLLTGTPSGVGNARVPPIYLADGDEVLVTGSGIGELRNLVVATDLSGSQEDRQL